MIVVRRGRSRTVGVSFGLRRKTVWVTILITESTAITETDSASLVGNRTIADMEGLTLTRTIGRLYFTPAALVGAFSVTRVDYGIGLISQEAFGAGALPDPDIDFEKPISDWVYKDTVVFEEPGSLSAGVPVMHQWDVKSRRKIGDGELLFIETNQLVVTGQTMLTEGIIRSLFLLP